jgi:polyhydroxybutyrate depolymerase
VEIWRQTNACVGPIETPSVADLDPKDDCTVTRWVYTGGREGSVVEFWRVDGGGHTWPGGDQYLPKKMIGPVCRDFDASEEIWKFFRRTVPQE